MLQQRKSTNRENVGLLPPRNLSQIDCQKFKDDLVKFKTITVEIIGTLDRTSRKSNPIFIRSVSALLLQIILD
jgi:hypothetical protein